MRTTNNKQQGLSLLELMFVLATASILLSVGVPSFRNVIMDNRLSDQSNAFISSVNTARSAAIRYQRNAAICPIANYGAALPTCAGGTDWSNGWMVWVDRNRDTLTTANEVISVQGPMHDSQTFQSLAVTEISYNARGFLVAGLDDLTLCDDRPDEQGRIIQVNGTGHANVTRQACP